MSTVPEQLAALQATDAAEREPVHWHYLQTLARRAQEQTPAVQQLLEARLQALLTAFQQRLSSAAPAPQPAVAHDALSPLRELTRQLQAAEPRRTEATPRPLRGELRSLRQSRETWSRLHAERQLAQALAEAPQNAGPIHSERVVLRTLQRMHALSPAYFQQFMAYADALLSLEKTQMQAQVQKERPAPTKAGAAPAQETKPKARSTRQRRSPPGTTA